MTEQFREMVEPSAASSELVMLIDTAECNGIEETHTLVYNKTHSINKTINNYT